MKTVIWSELSESERCTLLERPAQRQDDSIKSTVTEVIRQVQSRGDQALRELTQRYDGVILDQIRLGRIQQEQAARGLSSACKKALRQAYRNIFSFHQAQQPSEVSVQTQPGVLCEQVIRAYQSVGLYIPGGSAPLPSTVLMLGIPAQQAGCERVVLCSPPPISDEILYAASLCGIDEIYCIGGAQAVAAMAYGTESILPVDKIFGPGNSYVTQAKRQVSEDLKGAAIDMPAGPSEVLIIADDKARADFVAADLLSQAEHGPDSQVVLVSTSDGLLVKVQREIQRQRAQLSRDPITAQALDASLMIQAQSLDQCCDIANRYAPEHLMIQTRSARSLLRAIKYAGSVFLGDWSPESAGDYASGTNHVLPTYGYARRCSSLGLADYYRRITVQELTPQGLLQLAETITEIAGAEKLDAHQAAVTVRVEALEKELCDVS
ncbi:histidinol dehydrogenase [Dongshaea marina]|uniref:histidinol dehydrogenase n=1 Tax=Dongshaea marina TaxID=2047966 RepID=UPI000D3E37D0|nr:histidinol dehydrogenase [Dongshaea marina]